MQDGASSSIAVPVTDSFTVNVDLIESEVFEPGQKKVQFYDENEVLLWEEPLELRTFVGTVAGFPGSVGAFTFDSTGFIGNLQLGRISVNYLPVSDDQVIVDWTAVPMTATVSVDDQVAVQAFLELYEGAVSTAREDAEAVSLSFEDVVPSENLLGWELELDQAVAPSSSVLLVDDLLGTVLGGWDATPLEMPIGSNPQSTDASEDGDANSCDAVSGCSDPGEEPLGPNCLTLALLITDLDLTLLDPLCVILMTGLDLFLSSSTGHEVGRVRPYADLAYRNAHSNYATRITNAYNIQKTMWRTEVNIELSIYTIFAYSSNYSTSTNCSQHRQAFTASHATLAGIDVYQLFTGIEVAGGTNGCAPVPSQPGVMANTRDNVIEAVDHSIFDLYDPDETDDMGGTSGHEMGHSWGEPRHPKDRDTYGCDCYNIMATKVDPDQKGFWFNLGSDWAITTATQGRLTDPPSVA